MSLSSKVALVTGGASGLGTAFSHRLLSKGAKVGLVDIATSGVQVSDSLNKKYGAGSTTFFKCDVTNKADLSAAFDHVASTLGPIDYVFNNAGIGGNGWDDYELVVDINLTAVIHGTVLGMKHMEGRGGVIVNTASMAGLFTVPITPVYAATKAAVVHFTRSLAHLAVTDNIRVNAICPGFTDTPLVQDNKDVLAPAVEASGGLMRPEDVAEYAVKLVENDEFAGDALAVDNKFGAFVPRYHPKDIVRNRKLISKL